MADVGDDFDVELKLLLVGDSGVGKTSILLRFCDDLYNETFITTIGIDSKTKMLTVGDKRAKIRVWDTAGQERFRTLSTSYFRKAQGAVMVYDVTDARSFDSIRRWLEQLKDNADRESSVIIVGNKADLTSERQVTTEEGASLAAELGVQFFEVSAKAGTGVDDAFLALSEEAIKSGEAALALKKGDVDLDKPPATSKGCACSVM